MKGTSEATGSMAISSATRVRIESTIVRRRIQYENKVWKYPLDYDTSMIYIWFEDKVESKDSIRELYERVVAKLLAAEQNGWLSYIEFKLRYKEVEKARNICDQADTILPRVE
ncbi:hypothetical protein ACH5RR_038347 [Cinchona calisaya]|uniref:Uncharacterized protein n=1 Tax=Cinchona calisaya TaxID=153742 RepID=A0ABD2XYG5_9GENT